jgi:hypothetical protein
MPDSGQIKLEWLGNSEHAQKALDALVKKNDELTDAVKRAGKHAREDSEGLKGYFNEQIGTVGSLITQYATLEKAIDLVGEAYEGWRDRMREAAEAAKALYDAQVPGLATQGFLGRAGEDDGLLQSNPLATRQQMQQIASEAGGAGISFEQRSRITQEAGRASPILDDQGRRSLARRTRSLVRSGMSEHDAAEVAFQAGIETDADKTDELFGDVAEDTRHMLGEAGLSPTESMAVSIDALNRYKSSRGVRTLAGHLTQQYSKEDIRKARQQAQAGTRTDRERAKLMAMTPTERLEAMKAHPELLEDAQEQSLVRGLAQGTHREIQEKLEGAVRDDVIGGQLATERGKMRASAGRQQRLKEDRVLKDSLQGEMAEQGENRMQNALEGASEWSRFAAGVGATAGRAVSWLRGESGAQSAQRQLRVAGQFAAGVGAITGNGETEARLHREEMGLRQEIQETNRLLREQNSRLGGGKNAAAAENARANNGKE